MFNELTLAATKEPLPGAETAQQTVETVSNWWDSELARTWLIDNPISIGITLLVAVVAHWVLRRLIDKFAQHNMNNSAPLNRLGRKTRAEQPEEVPARVAAMNKVQEKRRQSRVKTLAQVGKSAVAIVVWVFAVLSILDTLGVNIAPLIASAGVIGVAIGFGAQSLVKDFLSGIFMLLEDQYGVGDTIDVGEGIIGDVEDISLRLTTIRDIDGTLWYVRNGEILRVGNFSDEYAIARIQVPVGLSNDSTKAWEVIQRATEEACADPTTRDWVLDEPEMKGVSDFEVDHLSYRISIKTMPGMQWDVQRLVQGRILDAMRENNITVPYPHGIGITRPGSDQEA
ncbi:MULTISPECIES: mechanosensitive ion channel family protein [unclassified Corynebacterium]|uniref:mechanosensitive ion channel family protein n=1 Tax=unclassified Corynebacterium TaxID=2624378 RepID=UPI0029CA938C|nr:MULTISPECIES: mechanosensitive ion channel family protein [unclassified Corynebacterium]WPF65650.1 mechanosensitive ion channel family protein [Corynebacterium sp. 22KM0430]WPF68146.1 mechanosensitive ion channel family protein [Corynebacterium sp. 21KM1197]